MNDPTNAADAVRAISGGVHGVQITNVRVTAQGASDFLVTFDIGWGDSWRCPAGEAPGNWDAAWVFFKLRYQRRSPSGKATRAIGKHLAALDASAVSEALRDAGVPGAPAPTSRATLRRGEGGTYLLVEQPRNEGPARHFELSVEGGQLVVVDLNGRWEHARVQPASTPSGKDVVVQGTPESTGVFVYRSATNTTEGGAMLPVVFRDVSVVCALPDVRLGDVRGVELWPFGLEMVYVPEGPFHLGDPEGAQSRVANCFYDSMRVSGRDATYYVDSEGPIQVGQPTAARARATKLLWYDNDDMAGGVGDQKGPVPAPFPKGYRAFYLMKRQITQGQYADFVNTLWKHTPTSYAQMLRHPYGAQGSYRGTLQVSDSTFFIRVATRPARACNFLSWADGTAFAAWAALRPMSELEYEKACRGAAAPIAQEFAWGSTELINGLAIVGDEGGRYAMIGNASLGNGTSPLVGGDGGLGPVEDDVFAAEAPFSGAAYSSVASLRTASARPLTRRSILDRVSTGRSYYGIPALTGNLWELCVTVGNKEGRSFTGDHGDGSVTAYGQAPTRDVGGSLSWPGPASWAFAWRGGSWFTSVGRGYVAARPFGSGAPGYFYRSFDSGFRAARTAP
ncbi:uncharacterized protein SOCE26_025280 [Sorangium cellulosum]|uniref:Sulfatase-modifying factor enzyme-like domain-containing protein n=1 Tax=Sorangium cellulosum TaxID=56 RepID=A0A2L0EP89_SORCE|nr:SUMF1/EgtB/PvdO family nonheme iron enzyme [Sorangium cellulosum]AUX41123.1 uncharacterized protein SOCE26_025280 [Sorangium cellulosum]